MTNYEKLFGTPERAAQTIGHVCQFTHDGELCDRCQAYLFVEPRCDQGYTDLEPNFCQRCGKAVKR